MGIVSSLFKFAGYILLKWALFYLYQFLESGARLNWNWSKLQSFEDYFYTTWMLFVLPILEVIILIWPFQIALKQKGWVVILILIGAFALEFIIGWYATNQRFAVWMIVKIILSAGLFFLLYKKQLSIISE